MAAAQERRDCAWPLARSSHFTYRRIKLTRRSIFIGLTRNSSASAVSPSKAYSLWSELNRNTGSPGKLSLMMRAALNPLSEAVRWQDLVLRLANEQLIKADQEKTKQVMLTTHDLKAPLAGIESHIQVLKTLYWGKIPEPVQAVIERIDHRAQSLRKRIRDILILGDLKARGAGQFPAALAGLEGGARRRSGGAGREGGKPENLPARGGFLPWPSYAKSPAAAAGPYGRS